MRSIVLSAILVLVFAVCGCEAQRESAEGFRLPDGDPKAGEQVYAAMSCASCHGIANAGQETAPTGTKVLALGGTSSNLPSDGYLVTAIINPSHVITTQPGIESTTPAGDSRMLNFNKTLKVSELIDLVAYLQTLHEFRTAYEGHGLP